MTENTLSEIENLFSRISEVEVKRPYRLNVIDELHINENGHSRVLTKLLQYKSPSGRYEFLESLIQYINTECRKNFGIQVAKPIITQEEERIDLWVRDKEGGYAIILENKACDACDQDAQLYRYIEKTEAQGFLSKQIYIIYMPSVEDHDPSMQSWQNRKEEFEERYAKISFKNQIIPWIEKYIIPNIRQKDQLLLTGLIQYLDYLKEIFNINKIDNMDEIIKNQIDLSLDLKPGMTDEEKVVKLNTKIGECQKVLAELQAYQSELSEDLINRQMEPVVERFKQLSKDIQILHNQIGITLKYDQFEIDLLIGNDGQWYCQLQMANGEDIPNEISRLVWVSKILPRYSGNRSCWKYCKSVTEAIEIFNTVLTTLNI